MIPSDRRSKMCGPKIGFPTKHGAEVAAKKLGHRPYECPICFCWHTTKSKDWQSEYVLRSHMDRRLTQQETTIRRELNSKVRALKLRISELEAALRPDRSDIAMTATSGTPPSGALPQSTKNQDAI